VTDHSSALIAGRALSPEGFQLAETSGYVDVAAVLEVLSGRLAAYRVSDFLAPEKCEVITRNFWASADRQPRYGDGEEGVEAYLVGASHIDKSTDEYLRDAGRAAVAISALYAGAGDPIADFRAQLAAHGAVGGIRAAQHDGRAAGNSKAVCWNKPGEYLLLPHDDLAQLSDPLQAGFEIQQVHQVMAVNVYPQVSGGSGQVKLWNVEPDEATRDRLGLSYSGYPYPPELLAGCPGIVVAVRTGDLCLINGNLVHAALGRGLTSPRDRLLLTCFMGLNGLGEMLWWT
jgi:hypothetical protein